MSSWIAARSPRSRAIAALRLTASAPNPAPSPPRAPDPTGDGSNSPLWRDAEKAEADGDFAKAEELYTRLAMASNKAGDVRLANLCYEGIQKVRELGRTGKSSAGGLRPAEGSKSPPPVEGKPGTVLGDGTLRTVRFEYLGRKVYALTGSKGEVRLYLVADGIDLDRYVGKWLEVAGTVAYPKEFGGDGLLTGTRIESSK